jgi:hypothetical protein
MKQRMIDRMQEETYDNLYTPKNITYPILKYLDKSKTVWECCDPGFSNISKELRWHGCDVISSDKQFDFLNNEKECDYIITNPPYSLKDKFIERCYELRKPFFLLLPITALEGVTRGELFRKYGISCIIFDRRIDFTGKGSNWFGVAWFHWGFIQGNNIEFYKYEKDVG